MSYNADEVNELAKNVADLIDTNFLAAARMLRRAYDQSPEMFGKVAKSAGIGRRHAHYLLKIDRKFARLGLDRHRLCKIGWTKLQIIADAIDPQNAGDLLVLAEVHSAQELKQLMEGEQPVPDSRCVLLYMTPGQYDVFERVVLGFGAQQAGRGLSGKERALNEALSRILDLDWKAYRRRK